MELLWLLLIFILLTLPSIVIRFSVFSSIHAIFTNFILSVLLLLIPVVLFYKNIKIYFYLLTIFVVIMPLFVLSYTHLHFYSAFVIIHLFLQATINEIKTVLAGNVILVISLMLIATSLYLFFISKLKTKRVPFKLALSISLLSLMISVFWIRFQNFKYDQEDVNTRFDALYPMSVIMGVREAIHENNYSLKGRESYQFNATINDTVKEQKIFVFVIGESSSYYHWGINGYKRNTSPFIDSNEQIINFTNVVSGSYFTRFAVPPMISLITPKTILNTPKVKGIASLFKEVGIKTAWLSTQDINIYARNVFPFGYEADIVYFPNINKSSDVTYDDKLLPLIDSVLSTKKDLFIVVNFNCSHWNYEEQYPKQFEFFKPVYPNNITNLATTITSSNRQQIINSYDNSIRFTDYLLGEIISKVEKKDAVSFIAFRSDHGEDVLEKDSNRVTTHMYPSKETLKVPQFIWTSKKYQKTYPEKIKNLQLNKDKPSGGNDIFFTVLGMANISFPKFNPNKDLSSNKFINSNQAYYDPALRSVKYFRDLKEQ